MHFVLTRVVNIADEAPVEAEVNAREYGNSKVTRINHHKSLVLSAHLALGDSFASHRLIG